MHERLKEFLFLCASAVNKQMNRGNAEVQRDPLTETVIGLAIEVHRHLGPGLLESAYEECLCFELKNAGLRFSRQVPLPIDYKGVRLEIGYRIDILVEDTLIVELKNVERLQPIHDAQILTYMRLAELPTGLLLNFNMALLKDGIRRMVLSQFAGNKFSSETRGS